ncbi:hypothetical protein ACTMTJ_38155 [Phytohabitans sp. LJ34]|uniref:hypothetical protein n=1 Tax=Phytohabitans sp. LJ34 TaxID=3452217 RepID=UPI003F895406
MTGQIRYTARLTNAVRGGHQLQVTVYAHEDGDLAGQAVVAYPVRTLAGGADQANHDDAITTLANNGWSIASTGWRAVGGFDAPVVEVEPVDWRLIVEDATAAREAAEAQAKKTEAAWRFVVKQAQSPTALGATATAKAARISRERVYQIRDDRR